MSKSVPRPGMTPGDSKVHIRDIEGIDGLVNGSDDGFELIDCPVGEFAVKVHGYVGRSDLQCAVCHSLLRDCIECPECHNIFCRSHLVVYNGGNGEDGSEILTQCPCDTCSNVNTGGSTIHPVSSFLTNIPVQRMADATQTACEECDIALSWGDLQTHICDEQEVICDLSRWGCAWRGRQVDAKAHKSSCFGRLVRAEEELAVAQDSKELAELQVSLLEKERKGLMQEVERLRNELGNFDTDRIANWMTEPRMESGRAPKTTRAVNSTIVRLRESCNATTMSAAPNKAKMEGLGPEVTKDNHNKKSESLAADVTRTEEQASLDAFARAQKNVEAIVEAAECRSDKGRPDITPCLKKYVNDPKSLVDKRVVVFWPRQGSWYPGKVTSYNKIKNEHRVEYDDGDVKDHKMLERAWGTLG
ncbi:unnamed protein product [Choristocarpus tenellus]